VWYLTAFKLLSKADDLGIEVMRYCDELTNDTLILILGSAIVSQVLASQLPFSVPHPRVFSSHISWLTDSRAKLIPHTKDILCFVSFALVLAITSRARGVPPPGIIFVSETRRADLVLQFTQRMGK